MQIRMEYHYYAGTIITLQHKPGYAYTGYGVTQVRITQGWELT